ncbi:LCP family protein [Microbacterium sp. ASV49]|uniref:LCP family protein n=1 Tax=Microbacterium candidum TaxID=3041922 RepID=A0ABT7N0R8_9MICO|nr:LCP family protein [Microbacterium sp. ASV49]MDL9980293.1 LCP family protein [Microbacterium sp. ASV49]
MSSAVGGAAGGLVEERPLRYPDASSPEVMENRGWWLVGMNFLLPGSAQVLAGNRRLGRFGIAATLALWVLAIVGVIAALLWRTALVTLLTNTFFLLFLEALIIGYIVLWVILTIDTLRLVRFVKVRGWARVGIPILAISLLVASGAVAGKGAVIADSARGAIGTIFAASGPSEPPSDGYYNILLLGGDDGQGRDSMRFDSISVVSINADTGQIARTGVPRDLAGFPFVDGSPMRTLYPTVHKGHSDAKCGWGGGINQLNTEVGVCKHGSSLYPDAVSQGSTPSIEATRDAVEGITGLKIQYYLLMNYGGFAQLVDALGGVDITVTQRLPEGGPSYDGEPVQKWATGWIEPGKQHMDGNTAQWYARSRETTSDFDRVKRQSELQDAILKQANPANLLTRFQEVAAAGTNLFKTDIPESMLGYLADLGVKSKSHPSPSIVLDPNAGVDQFHPDVVYVKQRIQAMLHPPTPTPKG